MDQGNLSENSQGDELPELLSQDPWRRGCRRRRRRGSPGGLPDVDRALTLLFLRHYLSDEGRVLESIGRLRWTDLYDSDCGVEETEITMHRIKSKTDSGAYQISAQFLDQLSKLEYTLQPSNEVVSNFDTIKFEPSAEDLVFLRTEQVGVCVSTLRHLHPPGLVAECPPKSSRRGHVVSLVSAQDANRINSAMPLYDYDSLACSQMDRDVINRLYWSAKVPIGQRTSLITLCKHTHHEGTDNVCLNPSDLEHVDGTPVGYTITTHFADLARGEIEHYLSGRKVGRFKNGHPGSFTPPSLPPPPTTPSTDYADGCDTPRSVCSEEGCGINFYNDNNAFRVVDYGQWTVESGDDEPPALV